MSAGAFVTELPRDRSAPATARRHVEHRAAALPPDARRSALLLVSELVSNAVLHGKGRILLSIAMSGARCRIEVSDEGGGRPQQRADPGPEGGWGLRLVAALAASWGVDDGRTAIWFELA